MEREGKQKPPCETELACSEEKAKRKSANSVTLHSRRLGSAHVETPALSGNWAPDRDSRWRKDRKKINVLSQERILQIISDSLFIMHYW